ncbi:MAG: hypothetical protein ACRBBQ_02090 [Cognatishimia sp.]
MTTNFIYGPRATELRKPVTEQECISFVLDLGETDMMCWEAVESLVQTWCDEGSDIATASGRILDIERAEYTGEAMIYDVEGHPIILERGKNDKPHIYLVPIGDCLGTSPRRRVNDMRSKLGKVSHRRVSMENLSRYFWIAVAMQIFDQIMK